MALMNLKGIMKQKTMPMDGTPPAPQPFGGLLKKKKPSASTEVKPMPNLMKRLTGK